MAVVEWYESLENLRHYVVRVVFIKKGNGNHREMWATRNPDLIADYVGYEKADSIGENNNDQLAKQKRNNNLIIFDLEKQEFRTVPLDNVVSVDPFTGVPGWVNFNFDEPWLDIINGNLRIEDYLNYNY